MGLVIRRYSSTGRQDLTFGGDGEARHEGRVSRRLASRLVGDRLAVATIVSPRQIKSYTFTLDGRLVSANIGTFLPDEDGVAAVALTLDVAQQVFAPRGNTLAATVPAQGALASHVRIVSVGQAQQAGMDVYDVNRHRLDGTPDTSFSNDGRVRTRFDNMTGGATSVAVDRGRRVIAAGSVQVTRTPTELSFVRPVRYTHAGVVDEQETGFRERVVPDDSEPATCMAISASGREIFVGGAFRSEETGRLQLSVMKFGIGADRFGDGPEGIGNAALASRNTDPATDVKLDRRGRIIAVSQTGGDMGVFRFTRQGKRDASFGVDGHVSVPFDVGVASPGAIVVDAQERIIIVGEAAREFALVRLRDDGSLDQTFGLGGKVFGLNPGRETLRAHQVVLLPDGGISAIGESFFPV
jgi:uncharacterized delta-60 repeat protein